MLTRKQRWRRVRTTRSPDIILPSTKATPPTLVALPAPHFRPEPRSQTNMHPLQSLAVGNSLLHLLRPSDKPTWSNDPAPPAARREMNRRQVHGVHFNHQVRVVLVPSRTELKKLKAEIWWGEEDYYSFRREYIAAARANLEINRAIIALRIAAATAAAAAALERDARRKESVALDEAPQSSTHARFDHPSILSEKQFEDVQPNPKTVIPREEGSSSGGNEPTPTNGKSPSTPDISRTSPTNSCQSDSSSTAFSSHTDEGVLTGLSGERSKEKDMGPLAEAMTRCNTAAQTVYLSFQQPLLRPDCSKFWVNTSDDEDECRTQALSSVSCQTDDQIDMEEFM